MEGCWEGRSSTALHIPCKLGRLNFQNVANIIIMSKMLQIPYDMKGSISHMLQMPGKTRGYISRMTFHTTVLFANVCFPAFFGLDGVVSFLSLRLYTALVASWLHRFVGVDRNHNHNRERKRNANTNTAWTRTKTTASAVVGSLLRFANSMENTHSPTSTKNHWTERDTNLNNSYHLTLPFIRRPFPISCELFQQTLGKPRPCGIGSWNFRCHLRPVCSWAALGPL